MIRRALCLCALTITVVFAADLTIPKNTPPWNETWTDTLKQHLLTKYDRFARPSQHYNTTQVRVMIRIITLEMDDDKNVMMANVYLQMVWTDSKLTWNSSDYGGLPQVHLGPHEIWMPDIYLLNSAVHNMEYYGDRPCIVYASGEVLCVPATIFYAYCHWDYTFWPFESNTCRLSLASWLFDGNQVNLTFASDSGIDTHDFSPASEWMLKNVTTKRREDIYKCCPEEPYITLDYNFELTRSSEFYYHIVFIPTIPIVILSLITFWLRPQSEIKLIINASIIVIVILYLIYFGYKVPPRHDSMPIIVRFYSGCLYQATTSLIVSAFLINIKSFAFIMAIPRPIRRFLLGKPGRYLGLGHIIQEIESEKSAAEREMNENQSVNFSTTTSTSLVNLDSSQRADHPPASSKSVVNLEWNLLAIAIDRLVFLLFCFTYIIMAISYVRMKRFTFSSDNKPAWHA